ncbi:metal-binding protein [Altericista sp. CCNU0014]|uniref:metal-binding protein n=1 Tax=Altericista sp. CCNU0014 TaxID=3082949 RepID=UPI00384D189B
MPSGATHDRITLASLPVVSGLTLLASRDASITLSLAGSFLFSGLMFGPDLDIYSVQFKRWGILRWIWRPYQKSMRHRSWLSHGPIVGTIVRLAYLGLWAALLGAVFIWIATLNRWSLWPWQAIKSQLQQIALQYCWQGLAILIGLELGALSHTWSDSIGSTWKKWRKSHRKSRP